MSQKYSNDAYSTLAASLGIGATTMFVTTGHGARWPEIVAPDICYSTLEDPSGNIEIVKITAHTAGSDQMTVARAQQGTTERGWSIADLVECRVTAIELTAFETDIDALEDGKQPLDADLTALAGLTLNGMVARTDAGTFAVRTIQAGAGVVVTYGNGVDGDPVINMSPSVGSGDVLGPASATDSTVALFDGISGKVLKGSTKALPSGVIVGTSDLQTLTGKTISLTSNAVSGTLAEFSTAVSDADLASTATAQTLTNKTIDLASNTVTGTRAQFNTACSDADFASLTGTETLTNKTLTNPTVTNYVETVYAPAAGSAFTVDLANGTFQKLSTNANVTITLPASAAGKSYTIMVAYGGTHTVTWAGGSTIKWADGTAPTATSVNAKFDIYCFTCDGTNTYGADGGRNY